MNKDRWQQIQELFDEAAGLAADERDAYLSDKCGGDVDLLREVKALLNNDQDDDSSDRFASAIGDEQTDLGISRARESWRGEKLGVYTIIDKIAEGGMGAVYLAERHDQAYEQKVAIKLISDADMSGELERRFIAERQILANLHHPNIAGLIDGGTSESGTPYLVMEYVSGESIDEYCDRHRLTIGERVKLFIRVCDAVQYAHQNLIIHRDIKPSNVLVTKDGEPKLIDFGIAKPISSAEADKTKLGRRAMTPKHASPEQLLGDPVTTASDVYGLGILLYELLSGSFPFDMSSSSVDDVQQIATQATPPLPSIATGRPVAASIDKAVRLSPDDIAHKRRLTTKTLVKRLRGDLDAIALKAISRRPADRYVTARQLREDLQRYLDDQPVDARVASLGYRWSKMFARYRLAVLGIAAIVIIAIGAESFHNARLSAERDIAQEQAEKANKVASLLAEILEAAGPAATRGADVSAEQLLDHGVGRIREDLADDQLIMADLLSVIGRTYRSLGLHQKSFDLVEEAVEIYEELLPENDERLGDAYYELGYANWHLGNLDASLDAHQRAYDYYKAVGLQEPHVKLAASLRELGLIYENLNDFDSAEKYYVDSLEQQRALYPQGDAEMALTQTDYAGILFRTQRYAEAEPVLVDALNMRRRLLGDDHPDVGQGLNNTGFFYWAWGDLASAERYMQQSLPIRVMLYGESSLTTALVKSNLAVVVAHRGRIEEGVRLAAEMYEVNMEARDSSNRATYLMAVKYLEVLRFAGRLDEVILTGTRLLGSAEAVLDSNDHAILIIKTELAGAHFDAGNSSEALRLYQSAESGYRAIRGDDHILTERVVIRIADIDAQNGNVQGAINKYLSFLEKQLPILHPHHPEICRSQVRLGELFIESGQPDRANSRRRIGRFMAGTT